MIKLSFKNLNKVSGGMYSNEKGRFELYGKNIKNDQKKSPLKEERFPSIFDNAENKKELM